MNAKLNNDAVVSIQCKKYRKATLVLNRALLISKYGSCRNGALESSISISISPLQAQAQAQAKVQPEQGILLEEHDEEPYIEDDYDEGMNTFPEPYSIPSSKSDNSEFVKLVLFYNLGLTHLKSSNNEDAMAYFEKAYSENTALQSLHNSGVPSIHSFDAPETIALFHNLGHSYFRCHRFDEALAFYDKALDLSLQSYGYYHISVSMTLNCIGVVRLHSLDSDGHKSTEDILGVFMEALAINEAVSTKCRRQHHQYQAMNATILNNIGRVRFARKEYAQAKIKYQESYRIRRCIYGPVHIDVAAVLYNIGEVQQLLGNYQEAISLYQNFLDITTVQLGRRDFDAAVTYKKIGQIFCDRNESDKAIEMYLKALDIVKSCLGETHTEVGSILNKIGNICYERQEYDIALKVYEEGLRLEKQVLDPNHPNIVITTINIARIHHQLGNLDNALLLHEEALVIQRTQSSTKADRLNIACTLSSIGLINDQRKQYWLAIDAFEEALAIRTQELGLTHFDISSTLNVSLCSEQRDGVFFTFFSSSFVLFSSSSHTLHLISHSFLHYTTLHRP